MEKLCSLCKKTVDSENAAILTLGGFGNPKYLCDECDSDMECATSGVNIAEIDSAMKRISKKMYEANVDDKLVLKTVNEIMSEASDRAEKIKKGEYDFSKDDNAEEENDEIPEELRETEEDKELERAEAEKNKKYDKIINIVCIVVFALVLAFLVYRIADVYLF